MFFRRKPTPASPIPAPVIPIAPPSGALSARATTIQSQQPIVLLVDADRPLLEQCQQAALEMGFRVKVTDSASMASVAESRRPFVIVTTMEVYKKSPLQFHMVVERIEARLMCVSPRARCELLKLLLHSARQAAPATPPTDEASPSGAAVQPAGPARLDRPALPADPR